MHERKTVGIEGEAGELEKKEGRRKKKDNRRVIIKKKETDKGKITREKRE